MRLFLYEYACAQPPSVVLPESVRREGRAMFEAVLEDARKLMPRLEVITLPIQDSGLRTQDYYSQADYALIIAPEFDGILERYAREALAAGCKLLGPMPEAIRLTADKWELYRHWKRNGVPTPVTWLPTQLPAQAGLYLQKHRYGAGSLGIGSWQPGELITDQHLVQQFIMGTPVSVALLISLQGTITPLLPAKQEISSDGHFSYLGGSFLNDESLRDRVITMAIKAVQGIPGLQGYIGIDAILGTAKNGTKDMVLEINPRLTTSYMGLRRATQNNLIQCMQEAQTCDKVVPINWFPEDIRWTS
jgi:tyramine---L-glutamate ligase